MPFPTFLVHALFIARLPLPPYYALGGTYTRTKALLLLVCMLQTFMTAGMIKQCTRNWKNVYCLFMFLRVSLSLSLSLDTKLSVLDVRAPLLTYPVVRPLLPVVVPVHTASYWAIGLSVCAVFCAAASPCAWAIYVEIPQHRRPSGRHWRSRDLQKYSADFW